MKIASLIPGMFANTSVLISTVNPSTARKIQAHLRDAYQVEGTVVSDVQRLYEAAATDHADIILVSDANCRSGELIPTLRKTDPELSIVVVLDDNDFTSALQRVREGAVDCILEEDLYGVDGSLRRILEERALRNQSNQLRRHLLTNHLDHPEHFEHILTADPQMFSLFMFVESIAPSSFPVLITGETGVGKELLAEAVHRCSGRTGPLVTENVAGLDDTLFSDTLFGHLPGAFTGADGQRPGLLEQAAGGTLFLDEIGDLEVQTQVKLLRLLEYGEYYPLGSDEPQTADVRIVVATNRDIDGLIAQGAFRSDLYFRLATHELHIPSLRERPEDIGFLFQHFVSRTAADLELLSRGVGTDTLRMLRECHFPGNVRELQALALYAIQHCVSDAISPADLLGFSSTMDAVIEEGRSRPRGDEAGDVVFPEDLPTMERVTDMLIDEALRRTGGNQSRAAKLIGITPSAVNKRLRRRRGTAM